MTTGAAGSSGSAPALAAATTFALDASAMIAYLKKERGWENVAELLADPANTCYAHGVNLCEIFYHFHRLGGQPAAELAVETLTAAGVVVSAALDDPLWQDAAIMISTARSAGHHLALGDSFGMALAGRGGGEFVTGDHGELDPLLPLALCGVRFMR